MNYYFLILIFFFSHFIHAQERCSSHKIHTTQLQDEAYRNQHENFLHQIELFSSNGLTEKAVYRIPVVVHVLYKTSTQNISDARILSQIQVLNEDYRKRNVDQTGVPNPFKPLHADCEVEFYLAAQKPDGSPFNGINRVATTVTQFSDVSDDIKSSNTGGVNAWNTNKYLNIWVGNLGGNPLGYALPPSTIGTSSYGVVVDYRYFGKALGTVAPYNKGRTLTHEIGHCLGLEHIWGDDDGSCQYDDGISDTPIQASETVGSPTFPVYDACTSTGNGIQFMNYMDYCNDGSLLMFTQGQKTRMRSVLLHPAFSQLSNSTIPAVGIEEEQSIHFTIYPNPAHNWIELISTVPLKEKDISILSLTGVVIETLPVDADVASPLKLNVSHLENGFYLLKIGAHYQKFLKYE